MKKTLICCFCLLFLILLNGCTKKNSEETLTKDLLELVEKDTDNNGVPKTINIGTQSLPDCQTISLATGILEKEMNIPLNVIKYNSSMEIIDAITKEEIDIGMLGSTPSMIAFVNDIDLKIIWLDHINATSEGLVVKNSSNINTIQDLKGKTIATPFASTSHYNLLSALNLNNISEQEVNIIDMNVQDTYDSWENNSIDGTYIWTPVLSDLKNNDGKFIITNQELAAQGIIATDVEVVSKKFADKYPEYVKKYINAQDESVNLYKNNKQEVVKAVSQYLNISVEEADRQMSEYAFLTAQEQLSSKYLGTSSNKGDFINTLIDMGDFLLSHNNIMSIPERSEFEKFVDTSYIESSLN